MFDFFDFFDFALSLRTTCHFQLISFAINVVRTSITRPNPGLVCLVFDDRTVMCLHRLEALLLFCPVDDDFFHSQRGTAVLLV